MPKSPPQLELSQLPGFTFVTTVDELAAAVALFPENERAALFEDKPVVMVNKSTGAAAVLRPDDRDGSWNVVVVEP
jgi:hypothetical protein